MFLSDFIEQLAMRFGGAGIHCGHGVDNLYDEAVYLVFGALGFDFQRSVTEQDRELLPDEIASLERLVLARVEQRIPVAYLLERAWFAGYEFHCDPRALIPRSPMAELINNRFEGLLDCGPGRVLDLCCGGGCIGIACALQFPACQVDLADISTEALALARKNITLHKLESRVETRHSDLFADLEGRYDLILANPPYVSQTEIEQLPPEYRHEPRLGLHGGGTCGADIAIRLLGEAVGYLNPNGLLILETGYSAEALQARFSATPFLWLDFENGGRGVCAISAEQSRQLIRTGQDADEETPLQLEVNLPGH